LQGFRDGTVPILVATDVASRGIDVEDVTHVVNYQVPDDAMTYIHRIGRTGRAGNFGTAITLVGFDELHKWQAINSELDLGHPVLRRTRSDWLTVGIITAIATAAVGLTVANSDISHASLNPVAPPGAEHQPALLESAPDSLTEAFRVPNEGVPAVFKPIVVQGLLISNDAHSVTAHNPDGSVAWTYSRDN